MTNEAIRIEAQLATRQAEDARAHAQCMEITNPGEYRAAAEELKMLAAKTRELDAKRKEATRPLDEAKKAIMAWFRPAIDAVDTASHVLRRGLGAYDAKQREAEQAAARDAVVAIRAGNVVHATSLTQAAFSTAAAPVAGVSTRQVWDFEIVDVAAVPREYLEINEQKIRLVVRALKEGASIPGIRVFTRSEMVVKS